MTDLEKYEAVNKTESYEEFEKVLRSFAGENGMIQGREKAFDINQMVEGAYMYYHDKMWNTPRSVTRMYGLRQQLMYLKYYNNEK